MNEIKDIRRYDSRIVKSAQSGLMEVYALLKEFTENFVLVGGWAPYFLLERYKSKEVIFEHIGSIDTDIAINIEGMPGLDEVYESIRQKLERNGYKIRKNEDGQEIPFSFEKTIQTSLVHVDFLASEYGGTGSSHRHQKIQDVLAVKSRGVVIAFSNNERFEIDGILPNTAKYRIEIKIASVVAVITMKILAFDIGVSRIKDTYDIYSILKYYKDGVNSVSTETKPFLQNKIIREAVTKLSSQFSAVDSAGPVGLADFMLPEDKGSEDWAFYQRDVFELVQEFLKGLK